MQRQDRHSLIQNKTQLDARILKKPATADKKRKKQVSVTVAEPEFSGFKRPGTLLTFSFIIC